MEVGIILNFLECDGTGLTVSPKDMWCWTNLIAANYNVFSAGEWFSVHQTLQKLIKSRINSDSLVWGGGYHPRHLSLGYHFTHANENQG